MEQTRALNALAVRSTILFSRVEPERFIDLTTVKIAVHRTH